MTTPFYSGNTKYGSGALKINNTDGGNNSAFGVAALSISTEKWNTAVGAYSGLATTSGISNTSVGANTLLQNTSGNYNTALGTAALCRNTEGSGNTAVGSNSIEFNLTGENNTIIGTETGGSVVTGSNNICLGYKAGTSGNIDYSNCILIGNNVYPTGSNEAIIGDGTQTSMNLRCSENPTMSGYTLPASTDNTNKIATCEWVQTAVGGSGSSLLISNNIWSGTNTFNNTLSVGTILTFPDSTVQTTAFTGSGTSLLISNNTWSGTNSFNNTTTFKNTITLNSGASLTFPDSTVQTTAYIASPASAMTTYVFTQSNITAALPNFILVNLQLDAYASGYTGRQVVRLQVDYALYGNTANNSNPTNGTLIQSGTMSTGVNPNFSLIIDLVWPPSPSTGANDNLFVVQSTNPYYSTAQTYTGINLISSSNFIPFGIESSTSGGSVGFKIGLPNNAYSTTDYRGNIVAASCSIRILSSNKFANFVSGPQQKTYNTTTSGYAYFVTLS